MEENKENKAVSSSNTGKESCDASSGNQKTEPSVSSDEQQNKAEPLRDSKSQTGPDAGEDKRSRHLLPITDAHGQRTDSQELPKSIFWIVLALVLTGALLLAFTALGQKAQSAAQLVQEEAVIEYGNSLDTVISQVVSGDASNIVLDDSSVAMDEEINAPAVGSYSVDVYDGSALLGSVEIYVNDTKAPEFSKAPQTVQVDEGYDGDILSYFEASDLSGVTLESSLDQVDFFTPGAYEASVRAVDGHGLEKLVNFTIQVIEGPGLISVDTGEGTVRDGILIVNKKNPLPEDYDPGEDPQAVQALRELIAAMRKEGLDVSDNYSGYRTYNSQKQLYEAYVLRDGQQAADTYSARPGYSEHQTGLTFDLKHQDGSLIEAEAETSWLEQHAAEYGFIIRYPQGKEDITGYQYEPWHLRYIGEKAGEIMNSHLTLEEYLGVEGGDYLD